MILEAIKIMSQWQYIDIVDTLMFVLGSVMVFLSTVAYLDNRKNPKQEPYYIDRFVSMYKKDWNKVYFVMLACGVLGISAGFIGGIVSGVIIITLWTHLMLKTRKLND